MKRIWKEGIIMIDNGYLDIIDGQRKNELWSGTRREFVSLGVKGLLAIGLAMLIPGTANGSSESSIKEVTADTYKEKVYNSKKPVIVLHGDYTFSVHPVLRMKKVIEEARTKFPDIDFYEFRADKFFPDIPFPERIGKYQEMFSHPKFKNKASFPATFMFHKIDALTGEKYKSNQLIDILGGGPTGYEEIEKFVKFCESDWIPTNITKPNGKFVWRSNNSSGWKKYEIRSKESGIIRGKK